MRLKNPLEEQITQFIYDMLIVGNKIHVADILIRIEEVSSKRKVTIIRLETKMKY